MVNRIMEILKHKNLTASKFADEIGVQRSSISHILSERNKPSLELIQKILNTYTEISSEWLLTGKNSMFNDEPDLFSQNQQKEFHDKENIKEENENSKVTNVNNVNAQKNNQSDLINDTFVNNTKPFSQNKDLNNEPLKTKVLITKTIERIIVFYSDKTFKEYSPE
jgi:transcriptional regulator with XRE-family HTH domain